MVRNTYEVQLFQHWFWNQFNFSKKKLHIKIYKYYLFDYTRYHKCPWAFLLKNKIVSFFYFLFLQANDSTCYKEFVAAFIIGHTSCYAFSCHENWDAVYSPQESVFIDDSTNALLLNPDKSVRASGREAFYQFEKNDLENCFFIPQVANLFYLEKVSFISVISVQGHWHWKFVDW